MTEKEKAAQKNCTTPITRSDVSTQPTRDATKLELVGLHLMENGPEGISALSALAGLHDLNPRNSISELRNQHRISILDEFFSHQHSGGGVARLKRYWLADRDQARKVAVLVNHWRQARNDLPLSQEQIARYLVAFPTKSDHQPAA